MRARLEKLKDVKLNQSEKSSSAPEGFQDRAASPLGPPPIIDPYEFELAACDSDERWSSDEEGSPQTSSDKHSETDR